jgi:hypothetical protein
MTTEQPPIVERLKATRPHPARPYKSDAVQPINPDGPEAAALIEELVEGLANSKYGFELLLREVGHACGDGDTPPWLRSSVERARGEVERIEALLAKVKPSKEEG